MIVIKYLEINKISALNNPSGVDMPFTQINQQNAIIIN